MKKILIVVLSLMLLPLSVFAEEPYKEGVHYTVLNDKPVTGKTEVYEFFSFYCPHCYQFEVNQLPALKAKLPEDTIFHQNHVDFIGREMGVEMSRAFAIAQVLKVSDKIDHALFNAIHQKKQIFRNRNDIKEFFVANGVDAKEFDSVADSFLVNSMMARMKQNTENAGIKGVPAIVVNDKYRVETGAIKTYDELIDIAVYLTKLK